MCWLFLVYFHSMMKYATWSLAKLVEKKTDEEACIARKMDVENYYR